MPLEKKIEAVNRLAEILSRSTIVIATDFRGLPVSEVSQLRRHLREQGIEYRVVKNILARFAAHKVGKPGLTEILKGPTALIFGFGEVGVPPRVLTSYLRSSRTALGIRGGLLDGQVLSPSQVILLSALPSREVLLAKLAGAMQAPLQSLVNVLQANLRGLAGVLQARIEQIKGH